MKRRSAGVGSVAVLIAVDLFAGYAALLLAHYVRFASGAFGYEELHPLRSYLGMAAIQTVVLPVVFVAHQMYRPRRLISWLDELYGVFTCFSITTVLVMVASAFLWRDFGPSRLLVAILWFLGVVLIFTARAVVLTTQVWLRSRSSGRDRVLIVGEGDRARLVLQKILQSRRLGYQPVGCLVAPGSDGGGIDLPVLGTTLDLGQVIREHRIDDVIVAMPSLSHEQMVEIVSLCQGERVNIRVYPDLFQMLSSGVETLDLGGLPLLTIRDTALRGGNVVVKRTIDLVGAAVGLVMLSVPLLLIGVLVKLTSPDGPVFHCQERVGLDGRPFQCLKFRSMRPDAEKETGPVWATPDDPRKTRLGAFLRRTSLDELPQLINVLLGEMSLVGPRPERTYFVEQFRRTVPGYWDRHREKGGITGWAQVHGLRGNTSIEERTAYDLWYVENWTPWLDVKIILKTPFAALRDRNAY
ncbi:MAG TPA: undecaprenyl-phosphate glucose phosphotransferase [Chloroflexota bacterium]|nr:undecaprenyl-phosphate glucose phosphotransferase [Chloroflexota bacterium]